MKIAMLGYPLDLHEGDLLDLDPGSLRKTTDALGDRVEMGVEDFMPHRMNKMRLMSWSHFHTM